MFLPNPRLLTLGCCLAGLLLQALPCYGQYYGFARKFGGAGSDVGLDVTTDAAGNIYVTGYFEGVVDFDPGAGVTNLTSGGGEDAFVVKLNSAGSLIWARRMGGPTDVRSWNIAVDPNGNVFTTGWFTGNADFDPGTGVATLSTLGQYNAYISKLDSSGNFLWVKRVGASMQAEGEGIAIDSSGSVYTTGYFKGAADFDPGPATFILTAPGIEHIYVLKLDSSGNFVWARQVGGSADIRPIGLTLANNSLHLVGTFAGTIDFDPNAGVDNLTSAGQTDIFVSKLDTAGNHLWARRFGSTAYDYGWDVSIDGNGNVISTGSFFGTVDFDPGAGTFNVTSPGGDEAFVSKLDASGNFVWAKRLGGADFDVGIDVAVDGAGNVYSTGYFRQTADFDPGAGVFNITGPGGNNLYVSKLDSGGNFVSAGAVSGPIGAIGEAIAVRGGNVYVTGEFIATIDADPGAGVSELVGAGATDVLLVNLTDGTGGLAPVISSGGIVMANLLPKVATVSPLSIISIFGQNFTTETILYPNLAAPGQLATSLGGVCLMMNGTALPIFAVTPTQINAQVSANKTFGPASFTVVTNCGTANALSSEPMLLEGPAPREATSGVETVTVEAATPSFFIFNPVAANGFVAARFNTGSAAVATAGLLNDQFGPSRPAKPGEIILLYGTGWGETTANLATGQLAPGAAEVLPSANRKITLGGIQLAPADVLYVGVTPQTAGLYQAAIRIPAGTTPGNKQVVLTVYGKSTPVGPVIAIGAP